MTAQELARSAEHEDEPPSGLDPAPLALWLARKGRWDQAHALSQEVPNPAGAWIHAWLHREEGDYGNACYWYSRAGKPAPAADAPLEDEWFAIASALCD